MEESNEYNSLRYSLSEGQVSTKDKWSQSKFFF